MALYGPDNWGTFRRRRHKSLPFSLVNTETGMNTIYSNYPSWLTEEVVASRPTSYERGNTNYSNALSSTTTAGVNVNLPDAEGMRWSDDMPRDLIPIPDPGNWPDPGLWAGDERVWRGVTIPQTPRKIAAPTVTKKQGPTAEERAEAWKQAMADAPGPIEGNLLAGVPPGGGSREHQPGIYQTGGYDLTSNRPIADTEKVRKRLYGIMGFA